MPSSLYTYLNSTFGASLKTFLELTEAASPFADSTANAHNFTVGGSGTTFANAGEFASTGVCPHFNGSGYASCSSNPFSGATLPSAWTVVVKFRMDGANDGICWASVGRTSNGTPFIEISMSAGKLNVRIRTDGSTDDVTISSNPTTYSNNTEYIWVITYDSSLGDGKRLKAYVDTTEVASDNTNFATMTIDSAGLATRYRAGTAELIAVGWIGALAFLSTGVSAAQVSTIYTKSRESSGPLTAAVIALGTSPGDKTASKVTINTTSASSGGVAPRVDTLQRGTDGVSFLTTVTSPDTTVISGTRYYYRISTTDANATVVTSNVIEVVARETQVYPLAWDFTYTSNTFGVIYGYASFALDGGAKNVYVDSAAANDGANGLTSGTPKKTIAAALALVTSGAGDHVLLKRGSVFAETITPGVGLSEEYPMLVEAYGTGARPVVKVTAAIPGITVPATAKYWAVRNVEFYASYRDPASPYSDYVATNQTVASDGLYSALGFVAGYVEDCKFKHCQNAFNFTGTTTAQGMRIRRCVTDHSYGGSNGTRNPISDPRAQTVFWEYVRGMWIEHAISSHTGHHEHVDFNQAVTSGTVTGTPTTTIVRVTVASDIATGFFNDCHAEFGFVSGNQTTGVRAIITSSTRIDAVTQELTLSAALNVAPAVGQSVNLSEIAYQQAAPTGGRLSTVVAGATTSTVVVTVQNRDYANGYFTGGRAFCPTDGTDAQNNGKSTLITLDVRTSASTHTLTLSTTGTSADDDPLAGAPATGRVIHLCNPQKNLGRRRDESHFIYNSNHNDVIIEKYSCVIDPAANTSQHRCGQLTSHCNFGWGEANGSFVADSNASAVSNEFRWCVTYEPEYGQGQAIISQAMVPTEVHDCLAIRTSFRGAQLYDATPISGATNYRFHGHNLVIRANYGIVGIASNVADANLGRVGFIEWDHVKIQCAVTGQKLIHHRPSAANLSLFSYHDSQYYQPGAADGFYSNETTVNNTFTTWTGTFMTTDNSSFVQITFPDSTKTPLTYATLKGITATKVGMTSAWLAQEQASFNADLDIPKLNEYLLVASGLVSSGVGEFAGIIGGGVF